MIIILFIIVPGFLYADSVGDPLNDLNALGTVADTTIIYGVNTPDAVAAEGKVTGTVLTTYIESAASLQNLQGAATDGQVPNDITIDLTALATTYTCTANDSADETTYPVFVDGQSGAQGGETDVGFTYNPLSGTLTALIFSGALSGNATTATTASTGTEVTGTANDATDETVYPVFIDGQTGSQGIESDVGFTYNPSSGLLTAIGLAATLTDGGILLGNGTGAIEALGVATNGQIPIGDGTTNPQLATITGTADEVVVTNAAASITLSLGADGTNKGPTGETTISFADGDATPDVSNGGTGLASHLFQTNNSGAQAISNFDDGTAAVDATAVDEFTSGDWFWLIVDDQYLSYDFDNTAGDLDFLERDPDTDWAGAAGYYEMHLWIFDGTRWNCPTLNGPMTGPNTLSIATLVLPFDESTDGTLTTDGQVHIRGDEDRISYDAGAGGEIAGEVTKSMLEYFVMPIDFTYVFDRDANHRIHLFEVNAKLFPNGIILDYVRVTYTKDPTTEITNADLKRADDIIGVANAAIIVGIDTTAGSFIEDTDANLNGNAVVAAGQDIYIELTDDPVDEDVLANVAIIFHAAED